MNGLQLVAETFKVASDRGYLPISMRVSYGARRYLEREAAKVTGQNFGPLGIIMEFLGVPVTTVYDGSTIEIVMVVGGEIYVSKGTDSGM